MSLSPPPDGTHASADWARPAYAWFVVGVLTLAYTCSFIDRQILTLLIEPIRRDLHITDTQVSLLGGLSSLAGPLVGGAIFVGMREIIQRFTENWMLWFGIVLLVIILGFRGGVVGTLSALFRKAAAPGKG